MTNISGQISLVLSETFFFSGFSSIFIEVFFQFRNKEERPLNFRLILYYFMWINFHFFFLSALFVQNTSVEGYICKDPLNKLALRNFYR